MKPPPLKKTHGIIHRRDFADYVRKLSLHLGIRLDSPDFESVRSTGHGIHITRRKEKLLVLELEVQHKWCRGTYCVLATDDDGQPYSGLTETSLYEVGSVVTTTTQPEAGPHYQQPDDDPHTCAAPEVDVTDTAEGAPVEDLPPEYFGSLSLSSLLSGAAALVANDGDPVVTQTRSWYPSASAPTDIEQSLGFWTDENAATSTRTVHRYFYRWRLVSGSRLRIEWDQGGSSRTLTINPGQTSGWYEDEVSVTEEVTDMVENVELFVL